MQGMTELEGLPLLNAVSFPSDPKRLPCSDGFQAVVTISIPVNRMTVRLEGNTGQYAGGRNAAVRGRCEGVGPEDFCLWPQYRKYVCNL
jgi:hypothetical protein